MRKILKIRRAFPNDEAANKLMYLTLQTRDQIGSLQPLPRALRRRRQPVQHVAQPFLLYRAP